MLDSPLDIKTLFISDLHLGSRHANTKNLLNFLDRVKHESIPEKIYIVGDFIDGWKLQRNWYWNNEANQLVRKLLGFVRRGTEIYWVAGNHDEFIRGFIHDFQLLDFGSIHIGNEFVHTTANGQRFLVIHGDVFDIVAKYAKWLMWLGDIGYSALLYMNRFVNWTRRKLRMRQWSLSKAIKNNVKKAVNYIGNFEKCLVDYSREKNCDGCICGHIHHVALKSLSNDFIYANCGDWVESCTAIYENHQGLLQIYYY